MSYACYASNLWTTSRYSLEEKLAMWNRNWRQGSRIFIHESFLYFLVFLLNVHDFQGTWFLEMVAAGSGISNQNWFSLLTNPAINSNLLFLQLSLTMLNQNMTPASSFPVLLLPVWWSCICFGTRLISMSFLFFCFPCLCCFLFLSPLMLVILQDRHNCLLKMQG